MIVLPEAMIKSPLTLSLSPWGEGMSRPTLRLISSTSATKSQCRALSPWGVGWVRGSFT